MLIYLMKLNLLRKHFEEEHETLMNTTSEGVLSYWEGFVKDFSGAKLKPLALKYLCIPATSTPSERAFSSAGITFNAKRANLDPDTVEKLVFLKENFELIPKDDKLKLLIEELAKKFHKIEK